jgi:thiamine-phosphate diphosphorylase
MLRCYVTNRRSGNIETHVRRAVERGIDMIQVREKDLSAAELLVLVQRVRDIARGATTKVLVNDRLDIALAAQVDGLHLPANGLPPDRVRPYVRTLGVSTHYIEEALAAEQARADYIVFGPVFDTPGKTPVGLEALRRIVAAVRIPVLGIGGITTENSESVMATGAAGIAGIRLFQEE